MIIVPNESTSSDTKKGASYVKTSRSVVSVRLMLWCCPYFPEWNEQHNPPPSYLDSKETLSTISSSVSTLGTDRPSTIPNIKPSNFINLNRANESIKGSWLIDPSLSIPPFLLSPPHTEGARSNLFLGSKNGAIDAEIFLMPTSYSNKNASNVILIQTQSDNGSVKTRLVSLIVNPSAGIH